MVCTLDETPPEGAEVDPLRSYPVLENGDAFALVGIVRAQLDEEGRLVAETPRFTRSREFYGWRLDEGLAKLTPVYVARRKGRRRYVELIAVAIRLVVICDPSHDSG